MLLHWLWLTTRSGLGARSTLALLRHFEDPEAVYFAEADEYKLVEGLDSRAIPALQDKQTDNASQILERCYNADIHLLTLQDAAYPERLRQIPDPPAVLYYRGILPDLGGEPVIGVVGTRSASPYGLITAKRMGYQLARCGAVVASGVANGIDSMGMLGALTAGRPVVGVLGCGADVVYPKNNASLYNDVISRGCLLTEFPPGTPPEGKNFPRRNRIISGVSCGVLVVEAPERSGALITAQFALDQGRDVFAVPGNIDVASSAGSNALLRQGAVMVQSGWDVMQEYTGRYPDKILPYQGGRSITPAPHELKLHAAEQPVSQTSEIPAQTEKSIDNAEKKPYSDDGTGTEGLSEDEAAILKLLGTERRHADEIIAGTGLPAARVLASLTLLEVKQVLRRLPGKFYERMSGSR